MIGDPRLRASDARRALLISAPLPLNWLLNGFYLTGLQETGFWFFVVDGLAFVVGPVVVILLFRRFCNVTLEDLGFTARARYSFRNVVEDSLVFTVIWVVIYWLSKGILWSYLWKYDWAHASGAVFAYSEIAGSDLSRVILIPYFAASAAFAEELYFRGVLHFAVKSLLPKKLIAVFFVVGSAVLFGAIHWEGGLTKILATTILGLVAARLFLWRRSLWPLMVAHFVTGLVFE